jgi:hypothetical protein
MKKNAYNLEKVHFPIRIFKDKIIQLDNMFLDNVKQTAF